MAQWRDIFAGPLGRLAAGLMLSEFVTALQALVVATVLPRVAGNLHGYAYYGYAFSAYLVAQFVMTPLAGAWADRFGIRRLLIASYTLVVLGLAFSGSAPTMGIFIAARAVEGAAGGMDAVIALGTVAKVFPARQRARILALFSTMWALPAVVGPAAGAFIADTIGWRWAFYAFIPLVALSAVLVLLNLRDTPTSESQPMDAIKVLAQPGLSAAIAAFFFVFSAFFGADGFVPLYLTHERHQPLIIGGFSVMLAALGWTFAGMAVPRLRSNLSTAALVSIAGVFLIAGCSVLTFATVVPIHIAIVLAFWMLGGAGIGVAYTTIFADVFERAESGREGAVTSSALMAALLGMVFGTGFGGLALTVAQRLGYSIGAGLLGAFGFALLSAMGLLTIAHRQSPPGESGRIIFRES